MRQISALLSPCGRVYIHSMKHSQLLLNAIRFIQSIKETTFPAGAFLAGALFLTGCYGGMYEPGMASNESELGASLTPPAGVSSTNYWLMENDIRLFHKATGKSGSRNLIYIHGGPGIPPATPLQGMELSGKKYRIHYYHQRGCGLSSRPFDRFHDNYYKNMKELVRRLGLRAQIADIERIRRILGDEKLILVGHSFGGFIAALYAAEFPHRVEKLVLVDPADVVRMPPPSGGLYSSIRSHLSREKQIEFDRYLEKLFDFGNIFHHNEAELRDLQNGFIPYYIEANRTAGYPEIPVQGKSEWTGGWSAMAVFFDLGKSSDLRPLLKQIRAKTLIIYGDQDLLGKISFQDYSNIKNVTYHAIHGSGHFPISEKPVEFSRVVLNFLQGDN